MNSKNMIKINKFIPYNDYRYHPYYDRSKFKLGEKTSNFKDQKQKYNACKKNLKIKYYCAPNEIIKLNFIGIKQISINDLNVSSYRANIYFDSPCNGEYLLINYIYLIIKSMFTTKQLIFHTKKHLSM